MKHSAIFGTLAAAGLMAGAAGAATLEDVKARGNLQCGVSTGLAGFAFTDENGVWHGFDVAHCRAVAAAIFDDPMAVKFTPTTGKTRFTALASGEVDMLARNTTWTLTRDADLGFSFLGVNYYDGQGFMVKKSLGVTKASQMDGATVCIQTGTTTELNLSDYFRANDMDYEPLPIETNSEAQQNYLAGACDVYTTDKSGLAATRSTFENPDDHVILPATISKEPLGPLVREGDEPWGDVVYWVTRGLVAAEEYGITSENVEEIAADPPNPRVARLLGAEGNMGEILGVENDFMVQAISAVGNYGELFDEYLTPVGLDRGLNALYTEGGLQYAPPMR